MPAVSYPDFSGGLDRRLSVNSQDANKLWTLRNAYITLGKRIKKRPGLRLYTTGLTGSFGLKAGPGFLVVFCDVGSAYVAPPGGPITAVFLNIPASGPGSGSTLDRIYSADLFQGFNYVVARYANGETRHHYVDGGTTYITDANCPHSISVTKAASRIFTPDDENVRYCAAGDARDWTTASDAGFLPAGLQQDTRGNVQAVGTFQDSLTVFFEDSSQIWSVAVDPSANAISKRLYGIGTTEQLSIGSFFSDLVFLSPFGFRSMTVQALTSRIDDNDVGVPVDSLVQDDIATMEALADPEKVRGYWIPELGQYWAVFDMGTYSKAWIYTFSRTSKIACWSEYIFPIRILDMTPLAGKVFLRDEDNLYEMSELQYTDEGDEILVEVEMAYQDAKLPGITKQFWGADMVTSGEWSLSFKYDPRDSSKETTEVTVSGDTRPGDLVGVEVVAPAIAPVFSHSADEPASIDALTIFYHSLGAM